MIRFTILGISVQVDPWFWITMAFIGGGMNAGSSLEVMLVLVFVFAGFLSILLHELGHAWMIRHYGLPTAITLQAFGGYATYPSGQLSRRQSFIVTAAGPGIQFVFGVLLIGLGVVLPIPEGSLFLPFLSDLIWVSIVWSILNCVPVFPLDGGQMLAAVLGSSKQHHVHLISTIVAVLIGLFAYLSLNTLLLPIFMGLFAWQNWQAYRQTSR